jgi:hypothetical protein
VRPYQLSLSKIQQSLTARPLEISAHRSTKHLPDMIDNLKTGRLWMCLADSSGSPSATSRIASGNFSYCSEQTLKILSLLRRSNKECRCAGWRHSINGSPTCFNRSVTSLTFPSFEKSFSRSSSVTLVERPVTYRLVPGFSARPR